VNFSAKKILCIEKLEQCVANFGYFHFRLFYVFPNFANDEQTQQCSDN